MGTRRNLDRKTCLKIASRYSTRSEFARGDSYAYKTALKNGWLSCMERQAGCNRESCQELARDCSSRSEFARKHPGAYMKALRNGWMEDYTWFSVPRVRNITHEMCLEMARECSTQKEFRERFPSAYTKAKNEGWYEELEWLVPTRVPRLTYEVCMGFARECKSTEEFWRKHRTAAAKAAQMGWSEEWDWLERRREYVLTREKCFELAQDCRTLKELKAKHPGVLRKAKEEGWIPDYTWLVSGRIKNTYERCLEAARKYTTMADFRKYDARLYDAAYKNGWLDDFNWLERTAAIGERKIDYVYAYEFRPARAVYVGRTVDPVQRDLAHHGEKSTVARYARKTGVEIPEMKVLERGLTIDEGLSREDSWVSRYRKRGWTVLNRAKTGLSSGSLGALGRSRYSRIHCEEEARKYGTLKEFSENAPHEYQKACRAGWIGEYVWLKRERVPHNTWTEDGCLNEAQKYSTLRDFREQSASAYAMACSHGWIRSYTWLSRKRAGNGTWCNASFKEILFEASRYSSRAEFRRRSHAACRRAKSQGWLDRIFPRKQKDRT